MAERETPHWGKATICVAVPFMCGPGTASAPGPPGQKQIVRSLRTFPASHTGDRPNANYGSRRALETDELTCKEFLGVLADYALQFAAGRDATEIALMLRRHVIRCAECARLIKRLARHLNKGAADSLCDAADRDALDYNAVGFWID